MIALALFLLIAVPGISIVSLWIRRRLPEIGWIGLAGTCGIVWTTFSSLILTLSHVGLTPLSLTIASVLPLAILTLVPSLRKGGWKGLQNISFSLPRMTISASIVIVLAIPFVRIHEEYPTGDVQKALYWAEHIQNTGTLPQYSNATLLNRDPVDFFTPGLHTLTAAVGTLSGDNLRGTAWFSYGAAMLLAALAAAIASTLTIAPQASTLTFLFASLNLRFLRYVLFPGYHYQNLIGEMVLLLALYVVLDTIRTTHDNRRWRVVILLCALLALPLLHQFTAFLSIFLFGVLAVLLFFFFQKRWRQGWARWSLRTRMFSVALGSAILIMLARFMTLPVIREKLSDLFTTHPHLTPFMIELWDYPRLFGASLMIFGIGGMIVSLFRNTDERRYRRENALLIAWTLTVLILGQGPRFFIDIPSARTLFYAVIPLSIFAGMLVAQACMRVAQRTTRARMLLPLGLTLLALAPVGQTAARRFDSVQEGTRVNTTMTKETETLLSFLRAHRPIKEENGILIDDWNRRRLTWVLLSPYRMLTRVGGDLPVIAEEASQSPTRKEIYRAHLDFEKIFMLGNDPVIQSLLTKHHIGLVGSAFGITDDLFSSNSALREEFRTMETVLYAPKTEARVSSDPYRAFLLDPETLANDVGDREDLAPHSAISLAATHIEDPVLESGRTVRKIDTPTVMLRLNVGTYLRPLWDKNTDGRVDLPLRLLFRAEANGAYGVVETSGIRLGTFHVGQREHFTDIEFSISPGTLHIDEHGFATITLHVTQGPLILDRVAVGPGEP